MSQRSRALENRHKSFEPKMKNYDFAKPKDYNSYQQYLKEHDQLPSSSDRNWQYHYWKNKKPQWWMDKMEFRPFIKSQILPDAIQHIKEWKLISDEEEASLKRMIESPDKENLYMAICAMIEYKSQIRRLYKLNRHKKK